MFFLSPSPSSKTTPRSPVPHTLLASPNTKQTNMASSQPKWQYPRRHAVTGEWPEPAMHWQRPPRPLYMHVRKTLANMFRVPNIFVVTSIVGTWYLFQLGNTSEDDLKLSRLGNSDYLDEHTFYKFGTYHVEPGMMTAEDEAKMEAKAAAAAAKAEAQKKQN